MKNFTNNFKHKTNPLWIRLLIMTFMLLAGVIEIYGTTVYFVNKPKWSQVNVHNWNGGTGTNWPGTIATKESYQVEGYDVYKCDIGNNKNFIFSNNGSNQTSDLHIDNGTWYYDGTLYHSKGAIEERHSNHTSINQFSIANTDVIYFDASNTGWTSCYMYIGHSSYSKRFAMTRVSGTKNLWKGTSFGTWNDAQAWYFSSEDWDDIKDGKGNCVLCKACYHNDNTYLMPYKSNFTTNNIYKASSNNQEYATTECSSKAWSWSSTKTAYTNYTVTLDIVGAGSVTVLNYDNGKVFDAKKVDATSSVGYKTFIKSITATADAGNKVKSIKIGSSDFNQTNGYEVTGNVTITVTFEETCETVAKEQYPMSPVTFTYNGNKQVPTISPVTGAGAVTSTVYKLNNTTTVANPTDAGTYTVYVTSSDGTTYCGASSLNIGTFTINKKSVAKEQYPMSPVTFTYNDSKQVPTINPVTGAGAVTSIVYKLNNTTIVANPTDAGTYTVYVTSNAGTNYTAASSLNIGTFTINKKTVAKEQYTISPTTFTYNGNKQVPTINPVTGAGTVTSIVYKLNNTTTVANPTDAGTYTVYVTSSAGTNYTAASNLNIGTFTINKKTVAKEQYSMSPTTFSYNGSKQVPTITPAAGAGAVTSTVYKLNNTTTVANPTDAGTYTVYVTSSAGTNYTAASNLNIGTFTINEVCEDPSNIVFTINSPQSTYYLGDKVAATLSYDGTEVESGHSWTYTSTEIGISGPAPKKGASFTFTLKKVTNSTDIKINLPKCSSGRVASTALNFAITALPAPTNATASVTGNTANLLWTPGVRDSVLIVRYAKDATATAPTANTKYIVGNEIGNGMVVYKGTGTSFSNSGLTYGNAYDYYFYTVNNNYYSTANNPKATVSVCPTAITGADNIFVNKTSEYTVNATTGALYAWRLDTDTEATLTSNGNTATVTAGATAGNATISVTISGGNCDGITLTKDITIKDGIVIYIRRPKSGDGTSVYSNWYNESSVKGGLPWVKQGPISGSNSNNQATTNNTGGTELTEAFTDCDGYTWDSFTPADSWSSFYLHALNDYKQDGWATFTKAIDFDKSTDNYFYLSGWSSGNYGVTITKTNAPALGITIDALGSTEVISNNMASFAALYLKGNCSGKELKTDSEGDFTDQTFLWQYSTDGTSWSTYTGGDGATWNNIRPTQAGKYKLICTMEDDYQIESNIITIATTEENYDTDDLINITSNLPIFMVNTGGKGFPSCVNASDFPTKHADALKKKRSVDVKIKVGNDIVYDRKARMNYRGSSSLNFKKKSYAFSSAQEYCGLDKDESPDYMKKGKMDMFSVITNGAKTSSEEKDWVLYAANPDPSMMRNILAIDTYKAMTGEWGVQNQYVELYVDGVYQGVYVFLDKITQGKERINVKWDVDDASKRGFILKFDKTDVADRYEDATGDQKTFESDLTGASGIGTYGTQVDQRFEIEYPEKGDIEDDGGSWAEVKGFIEAKVNAFESALKDGKFNEVRNMIDYQSWADFFIINEFVKNVDAYRASCIFVYEDNKLKAYPLWDYELSFNNQAIGSGKGKADPTGLLIEHDDVYSDAFAAPFWWTGRYSNHIYKGLLDDPCFVSMIKTRWDMHANGEGALTQSKLQDLVDSYTTALTTIDATDTYNSPKAREAKKWPYTYDSRGKADCNSGNTGYYASWPDANKTQANDLTALTTWIGSGNTGRRDNLDGIIEEMASDISFSLSVVSDKSTTTPWRPVIITVSSNSGYEYTITPEAAQVKDNGNQHTVYLARPEGTEGTNFATHAYTFTATSGETDQCGSSEPVSQSVQITLEDIEENCP